MRGGRYTVEVQSSKHVGLFLDKFLPVEDRKEKGELVEALKGLASLDLASKPYRLALDRWWSTWKGHEGAVCVPGTVRGRLVTGLGAESVMENGFRIHFTYGTPIIPGSGLKGVLRKAMPEEHRGDDNVEGYLFGTENQEGSAEFHDAWWIPPQGVGQPLALDILTPHHMAYMQKQAPPTDFDEPNPVQFLTVAAKQRFLFVIKAPTPAWKEYLHGLLRDVLRYEGVGAKRSAGYGVVEVE